ncbi:MAG: hypothetical protein CMJ80_13030 [Planctomycetaceae bacterium]|nr:hypothetical protein [Planctomycetaceae bacterium]
MHTASNARILGIAETKANLQSDRNDTGGIRGRLGRFPIRAAQEPGTHGPQQTIIIDDGTQPRMRATNVYVELLQLGKKRFMKSF